MDRNEIDKNIKKTYELAVSNVDEDALSLEHILKQTVAKRNDFIQSNRNSFSLLEQKAIEFMLSQIHEGDDPDKTYFFNFHDFYKLIGRKSSYKVASFTVFKIQMQELADKSIYVDTKDGKYSILVRLFNRLITDNYNCGMAFTIHPDARPYLMDLIKQQKENKKYYSSHTLASISWMKCKYSLMMYDLLKTYSNNPQWKFNIGYTRGENGEIIFDGTKEINLYYRLSNPMRDKKTKKEICKFPLSWSNVGNFKRDVLEPTCAEICEYTDLDVRYEFSTTTVEGIKKRKRSAVIFFIRKKTATEKKDTFLKIKNKYDIVDNGYQPTLQDVFPETFVDNDIINQKNKDVENIADNIIENFKPFNNNEELDIIDVSAVSIEPNTNHSNLNEEENINNDNTGVKRIIEAEYNKINNKCDKDQYINSSGSLYNAKKELNKNMDPKASISVSASVSTVCRYKNMYDKLKKDLSVRQVEKLFDLVKETYFFEQKVIYETWAQEIWADNFVSHYYTSIKADEDNTKTTIFNRLKDCLLKDYDNFADKVSARLNMIICDKPMTEEQYYDEHPDAIMRNAMQEKEYIMRLEEEANGNL